MVEEKMEKSRLKKIGVLGITAVMITAIFTAIVSVGYSPNEFSSEPSKLQTTPMTVISEAPAPKDVVVHIKKLHVKNDRDTGRSDPYVKVCVCGKCQKTPTQANVASCSRATKIECTKLIFKNCVPKPGGAYHIWVSVYDDDPWYKILFFPDDLMLYAGRTFLGNTVLTVNGTEADITLDIKLYDSCTAEEKVSDAFGKRSVPSVVMAGQPFNVKLALDINEKNPPKMVTIEESIPESFEFVNASPPPVSFNHTVGVTSWVFYGEELYDRDITYTVIPHMTGTHDFRGLLVNATGVKVVTSGDWIVSVAPDPFKPAAYILTDKQIYKTKDTMITIIHLANPTDKDQRVSFVWDFRTTEDDYWIPIVETSITLPPNSDESYLIPIPIGYWTPPPGFEGIWRVALFDYYTMDVISYDTTHWTYVPVPSKAFQIKMTPADIAEQIKKTIEGVELPS